MIIVYTGNGKGKTCACIGQALRGLGNGLSVAFGQFIKRDGVAGEQKVLAAMPNCVFKAGGLGFCCSQLDIKRQREKAQQLLAWARHTISEMLILDEALYAVKAELVELADLPALINNEDGSKRILVLSGRYDKLEDLAFADIITEMKEIRHPHNLGVAPAPGVEF